MKSKLLKKISYGVDQSREVVDGQSENIEGSSVPWRERENTTGEFVRRPGPSTQGLTSVLKPGVTDR
jgi:hypothetical protein